MKPIVIKRIYEEPAPGDGYRMLVDRLWPRGIKKETARLDEWNKNIAPSTELRKWFGHEPERFKEFKKLYKEEVKEKTEELNRIRTIAQKRRVTLLYGAYNPEMNQAIVLQEVLKESV